MLRLGTGALALGPLAGCYTYLPVSPTPPAPQERGAVVLNDQGRFLLGERLGPSIARVEGVLVAADARQVTLDVTGVRDMRGATSLWSGERVDIPADAIAGFQSRVLSRSRSVLLASAMVGAVAVATLGLSLDLFGLEGEAPGDVRPAQPPGQPAFRQPLRSAALP
jgi:hypothetical protein